MSCRKKKLKKKPHEFFFSHFLSRFIYNFPIIPNKIDIILLIYYLTKLITKFLVKLYQFFIISFLLNISQYCIFRYLLFLILCIIYK